MDTKSSLILGGAAIIAAAAFMFPLEKTAASPDPYAAMTAEVLSDIVTLRSRVSDVEDQLASLSSEVNGIAGYVDERVDGMNKEIMKGSGSSSESKIISEEEWEVIASRGGVKVCDENGCRIQYSPAYNMEHHSSGSMSSSSSSSGNGIFGSGGNRRARVDARREDRCGLFGRKCN